MRPFAPGGEQVLKTYYEVPEEIVEDDEERFSAAGLLLTRIVPTDHEVSVIEGIKGTSCVS
jgi:hypothetical protein